LIINLNKFAKEVTLEEGLKKSISIAQSKELMRIIFRKLANEYDAYEIMETIGRYRE